MKGTIPKAPAPAAVVRRPADAKAPAPAKAPVPAPTKAPTTDTKAAPTKPKPKEPDLALARKRVSVRMLDGTHLEGTVDWVSTYTVVLRVEGGRRHVIYKHAIAWMAESGEA